jgi:hypothetical protein
MFFRGNKLIYLWQTRDLAFLEAKYELVLERKKPNELKKVAEIHLSCGILGVCCAAE